MFSEGKEKQVQKRGEKWRGRVGMFVWEWEDSWIEGVYIDKSIEGN